MTAYARLPADLREIVETATLDPDQPPLASLREAQGTRDGLRWFPVMAEATLDLLGTPEIETADIACLYLWSNDPDHQRRGADWFAAYPDQGSALVEALRATTPAEFQTTN